MALPSVSPNLRLYVASRVLAAAGLTMIRACVAWHVYALTGSAFFLGLIGLVQLVPALTLSLPAGVVADRFERRRVVQLSQSVAVVAALALTAVTLLGSARVSVLFVIVAVLAAQAAFGNPARAALLPALVSREAFPRAVTISATGQALAFATGPALAGVILGASTDPAAIGVAYGLAALLLLVSVITLAFLRVPGVPEHRGALTLAATLEGVRFVARNKVVLGAMSLDMFAVIFGGAGALLPVFAADVLDVGARGFGALSASLEVGAVAISIALVFLPPIRRAGNALLVAVFVYGVATIVFGLSRAFPLSLLAYGVAGMADQVSVVLRQTTIQLATPDALRGRVSAVNSIFIGSSNQLAAVESGFVAAVTSAPFAVVTGGVGVLVVVGLVALLLPELRRFTIPGAAEQTATS